LYEILYSPEYTISGCGTGTVGFQHYYNDLGTGDSATFQISNNGGSSWSTLQAWTTDVSYATASFNINAYLSGASTVQFRWIYDDGDTWAWYWFVDDFTLSISL